MSKKYRPKKLQKANNDNVTPELLQAKAQAAISRGYTKQKWVIFCETLLHEGYELSLYEARQTLSKYITVTKNGYRPTAYKVRFSNHKPIQEREIAGDCDFFVGVAHTKTTTTQQALEAVRKHFAESLAA